MKKIILIVTLSLLTFNVLADSDPINMKNSSTKPEIIISNLSPLTPKEATFENTDSIIDMNYYDTKVS